MRGTSDLGAGGRVFLRFAALLVIPAMMLSAFSGCAAPWPELPDDAAAFVMGEYTDDSDDGAAYGTIEFEGRLYLPYGTLRGYVSAKDTDRCVGYIVMDEHSSSVPDPDNRDTRVYTLAGDPEHNYLMDRYTGPGIMDQPGFWRAADTRGKDIYTPGFIDDLYYGYWTR